ncbi:MAG: ribonuclease HI, partial [Candidatus Promineifilaceae bacterium]|nr:ribonuclease HI [Candidatus Promineifilaceae bacterium]
MTDQSRERVIIYTDGGADPNPGIGGWAAILRFGRHEKVLTGNAPNTTNNRMELTAAVEALRALNRSVRVDLHTDSEYLRKGITEWIDKWVAKEWRQKGKLRANADLWQELLGLTKQHEIEWHWVRGHSGNRLNERVDRLAREARLEITPHTELPEGAPRLYVRASCKGNPGPGAWGAVLEHNGETVQWSGTEASTTNNRMELMAVVEGLAKLDDGAAVQIVTTSDYVFQGATKWIYGWRRRDWKKRDGRPVSHGDLWQAIDSEEKRLQIKWVNAKGEADEELEQGLAEAGRL